MPAQIAYIVMAALTGGMLSGACTPAVRPSVASQQVSTQNSSIASPEPPGYFVSATVHDINWTTGGVTLETEVGTFSALVSPEDLRKLHEGDVIVLYISGGRKRPTIRI